MGRMMGLEPTNTGTTIRGLNHLATPAIMRIFIVTKTCGNLKMRKIINGDDLNGCSFRVKKEISVPCRRMKVRGSPYCRG